MTPASFEVSAAARDERNADERGEAERRQLVGLLTGRCVLITRRVRDAERRLDLDARREAKTSRRDVRDLQVGR